MNTNDKGRISELIAFAKFISLEYVVLEPLNKDGIYDCVIEKDGIFERVQIKTLRIRGNKVIIPMKSTSHNRKGNTMKSYTKEDVDWICAVSVELNRVYLVEAGIRKAELWLDINSKNYII